MISKPHLLSTTIHLAEHVSTTCILGVGK